jgi:SAM-dependent methyltransferase
MVNKDHYPLKYAINTINYFNNKNLKILEAGCGAGRVLKYFHYKNYKIIGIDFIENAIIKIKAQDKKIEAYTDNILATRFNDEQFDSILAFGLYHNFSEINFIRALVETRRILKINGLLCFSFRSDNIQNLILDIIKDNKPHSNTERKFHKLNLKEDEIIKILKKNNFDILKKEYVTNMPLLFHFKIFRSREQKNFNEHLGRRDGYNLNFLGKILNKFLLTFFKKQYCNIYVFYAKKIKKNLKDSIHHPL